MAHGPSLFSGHFAGPVESSVNPPAPIPPTPPRLIPPLPSRLTPPRIQTQPGGEWEVIGDPPPDPWEDFATWSNLEQKDRQQVVDRLEAQMKWGPRVGTAAALLTPFPFGVIPAGVGTSVGMGAAKGLYGIQHGPPSWITGMSGPTGPQWSFWDAFNPFGVSPAEQLSRNVMDLESSILATTDPDLPEGVAMAGWSGSGIPDDIQIDYGEPRTEADIKDLINAARAESERDALLGKEGWSFIDQGPSITEGKSGKGYYDEDPGWGDWSDDYSGPGDDMSHPDMFQAGGLVTADRGPGSPSNVRRGLGSLADAPWGDLARMDLSRLGRRW